MIENKREEEIEKLCIDGLYTDGAHHKQWYLEQILAVLYPEEKGMDILREELAVDDYEWEEGIPP